MSPSGSQLLGTQHSSPDHIGFALAVMSQHAIQNKRPEESCLHVPPGYAVAAPAPIPRLSGISSPASVPPDLELHMQHRSGHFGQHLSVAVRVHSS